MYENYIGCSRWTNPSKTMAIHITKTGGIDILCGKSYSGGCLERMPLDLSKITCKRCLAIYKKEIALQPV